MDLTPYEFVSIQGQVGTLERDMLVNEVEWASLMTTPEVVVPFEKLTKEMVKHP